MEAVAADELPVFRGHELGEEDLFIRHHILNLMCRFETNWDQSDSIRYDLHKIMERLSELENDGLVELCEGQIRVPLKGRAFIRNICMALDVRLWRNQPQTTIFSETV